MFFGKEKIKKYCTDLIKDLEIKNKVLLEDHWDNRFVSLTNLEKKVTTYLNERLDTLQVRVDTAIEQLVSLSNSVASVANDSDLDSQLKTMDKKRTEIMAAQAEISNEHRARTLLHMDTVEKQNLRQALALEQIAKALATKKAAKRG